MKRSDHNISSESTRRRLSDPKFPVSKRPGKTIKSSRDRKDSPREILKEAIETIGKRHGILAVPILVVWFLLIVWTLLLLLVFQT